MKDIEKKKTVKLVCVILLLIVAVCFVYAQYLRAKPPLPKPKRPELFNAKQREQMGKVMSKQLNLTKEQQTKIEKIDNRFMGIEKMIEMQKVLTPEQREKARAIMEPLIKWRVSERIKVLPPDQQKKFMEKLEARMKNGPPGPPLPIGGNQ
jgi:Spy/CpxP family protein refolding chaperone